MCVCVCVCMEKKQEANEQTKKIEPNVFSSYLTTQTSFVFTHIRTKRHTHTKKEEKKEGGWLPSTANK